MSATATDLPKWEWLIRQEPRLAIIALEIQALPQATRRSWDTYQKYKLMMQPIVGWLAENEAIQSCECWDATLSHTLDRLGAGAP